MLSAVAETWGDALVAFAWQCVLGLVTGIAGATGKKADCGTSSANT